MFSQTNGLREFFIKGVVLFSRNKQIREKEEGSAKIFGFKPENNPL